MNSVVESASGGRQDHNADQGQREPEARHLFGRELLPRRAQNKKLTLLLVAIFSKPYNGFSEFLFPGSRIPSSTATLAAWKTAFTKTLTKLLP
jgi:hypothetical protein